MFPSHARDRTASGMWVSPACGEGLVVVKARGGLSWEGISADPGTLQML